MILCIYLLAALELDLKFYEDFITRGDKPYEGIKSHMLYIIKYIHEPLNIKYNINPE